MIKVNLTRRDLSDKIRALKHLTFCSTYHNELDFVIYNLPATYFYLYLKTLNLDLEAKRPIGLVSERKDRTAKQILFSYMNTMDIEGTYSSLDPLYGTKSNLLASIKHINKHFHAFKPKFHYYD